MNAGGSVAPAGTLKLHVKRRVAPGLKGFWSHGIPKPGLPREVNVWRLKQLPRVILQALKVSFAVKVAGLCGVATAYGRLSLVVYRNGVPYDYGIAGYRVVTDAGVNFIVDAFQNSKELENMKYHGWGTGSTAESASQTALITELTTEYATDNTRPTGSQTENGANVYETAATLDPDAGVTLREHGIFDQAANSGGSMLDRTTFSAITLGATGDSVVGTYDFTVTSGG